MKQRTLRGVAAKGAGAASGSLKRILPEIRKRSGLRVLTGTVNVRLTHWYTIRHDLTIWAHEHGHHEHLFFERCTFFGRPALIVRTSQNHNGSHIVEVLATERVRRNHRIKLGDRISVRVVEFGPRPKEPGRK